MKLNFPQTRYQGSKLKLIDWFAHIFQEIKFETVLDAFGGTGAVSYLFKKMSKEITYNDLLSSNWYIGKALIENNSTKFDLSKVGSIFNRKNGFDYSTIIRDQFQDIYYTNEENIFLDITVQNILQLKDLYEKSLCLFALFQACIQKRPFNLFHRKNLYLRVSNVKRSFGNKKTWDTPFPELIIRALKEGNQAVFNNNMFNKALNYPILEIPIPDDGFDLVYLDPPYISYQGVGVDYRDFYHFLEGICSYDNWEEMIDYKSKHRRLKRIPNKWIDPKHISKSFEKAIAKFHDSKMVISYRDPGTPSVETLEKIMLSYKKNVRIHTRDYKYVLASKQNSVKEVVFVSER